MTTPDKATHRFKAVHQQFKISKSVGMINSCVCRGTCNSIVVWKIRTVAPYITDGDFISHFAQKHNINLILDI